MSFADFWGSTVSSCALRAALAIAPLLVNGTTPAIPRRVAAIGTARSR